jgi:hypothetical protein
VFCLTWIQEFFLATNLLVRGLGTRARLVSPEEDDHAVAPSDDGGSPAHLADVLKQQVEGMSDASQPKDVMELQGDKGAGK